LLTGEAAAALPFLPDGKGTAAGDRLLFSSIITGAEGEDSHTRKRVEFMGRIRVSGGGGVGIARKVNLGSFWRLVARGLRERRFLAFRAVAVGRMVVARSLFNLLS